MSFEKPIEFSDTGATLLHHRISAVSMDRDSKQSVVSVKSYISKAKFDAGCHYVGYTQLTIGGLPPVQQDVFEWAEMKAVTGEGSIFIGAEVV